jgi:hypothetical protein
MAIAQDIETAVDHLLDVAPVERSWLSTELEKVLRATGDIELHNDIESAALAYARAASERAYELGLELGKQAGKMTGAQEQPARVAL